MIYVVVMLLEQGITICPTTDPIRAPVPLLNFPHAELTATPKNYVLVIALDQTHKRVKWVDVFLAQASHVLFLPPQSPYIRKKPSHHPLLGMTSLM